MEGFRNVCTSLDECCVMCCIPVVTQMFVEEANWNVSASEAGAEVTNYATPPLWALALCSALPQFWRLMQNMRNIVTNPSNKKAIANAFKCVDNRAGVATARRAKYGLVSCALVRGVQMCSISMCVGRYALGLSLVILSSQGKITKSFVTGNTTGKLFLVLSRKGGTIGLAGEMVFMILSHNNICLTLLTATGVDEDANEAYFWAYVFCYTCSAL